MAVKQQIFSGCLSDQDELKKMLTLQSAVNILNSKNAA